MEERSPEIHPPLQKSSAGQEKKTMRRSDSGNQNLLMTQTYFIDLYGGPREPRNYITFGDKIIFHETWFRLKVPQHLSYPMVNCQEYWTYQFHWEMSRFLWPCSKNHVQLPEVSSAKVSSYNIKSSSSPYLLSTRSCQPSVPSFDVNSQHFNG